MNTTTTLDTVNIEHILRELTADEVAQIGAAGGVDEFPVIPR